VTKAEIAAAIQALDVGAARIRAREWPSDLAGLDDPGLYAWWVDASGARMLSMGLATEVAAGRIYAGQAGATAWPSGTRRVATLRSRIGGNHIRGSVRGSTFRLTLAAILRTPLGLEIIGSRKLGAGSEQRLTEWVLAHLELAVHPFPDKDRLGQLERVVLGSLDPPLNLEGMPSTPMRTTLSELRREVVSVTGTAIVASARVASPLPETRRRANERPTKAATVPERGQPVRLHDEIADILRARGNEWMTTRELAAEVNRRGRYHKRDRSEVTDFQIHGRTRKYARLFERDAQKVRLLG